MRCQNDPLFSSLCDRVGRGNITDQDEMFLKSRIQHTDSEDHNKNFKCGKLSIIVKTNMKPEAMYNQLWCQKKIKKRWR